MQTINRNNYEEYFLLYADNELDAETKLAVENFVQQNTDLAVELEMLLQTQLLPEYVSFADKETLIRTEGVNINENNYEEYFLLYIDNELSTAKRAEVEMYVLQHPKLQDEFTTLKKAVLAPETISYPDKSELYRKEKKRTIYLKPWRLAAAAIFIGVCAVGFWLMQKPGSINSVAVNHSAGNNIQQKEEVLKPFDSVKQPIINEQQIVAQQSASSTQKITAQNKKIEKINKNASITNNKNDVAEQHSSTQKNNVIDQPKPENIQPQIIETVTGNNDVAIENNSYDITPVTRDLTKESAAIDIADNNTNADNHGYKVYPVAYKELDVNDDNSLHVGAFDLNKNKVKHLLKKAGRLFTNKQNDLVNNDGKLQVANFEIQTNN